MKKNPNTTLAGSGLPRISTALPEVDSNGQVVVSPDREIEDAAGLAVPSSQCAICLRPFTDGHDDLCRYCWAAKWFERFFYSDFHPWTRCKNNPECHEPALCLLHTQAWVRAYQMTRTAWPVWAGRPIGGNPNEKPLDHSYHYENLQGSLDRVLKDALELASTVRIETPTRIETPEWENFEDRSAIMGLRPGFAFDVKPSVREGRLHVKCAMPGCSSEYISNQNPASKVRYVCSHHTDAQLRRARILKTDREDRDVHFDDPKYRFDHTTAAKGSARGRWSGSAKEYLGVGAYTENAVNYVQKQSCAQYAEDDNGRNDSDRGHSSTSGVHRPYKSNPRSSAYAPIDPAKILRLRRSVWDKPIFPVQQNEIDFIWHVLHYPCNSKLIGKSLVPYVEPVKLSRSSCIVPEPSYQRVRRQWTGTTKYGKGKSFVLHETICNIVPQVLVNSRFQNVEFPERKECVNEYPQSAWVKCMKCGVEEQFVLATAAPKEWLCSYCDPDKGKDDFAHQRSPLFAARRGDEGEEIEDAIPADTEAQERRLDEIITRWQGRVKLAERRGQLNENLTKKEFVQLLHKDEHLASDFVAEVKDFDAIDQGKKLLDKDATRYRRKIMDQIINSSNPDVIHSDLDWEQLLKPGSKEAQQFHLGGVFLLVKRERYRLYRLGGLDMPKLSPLGLPINPVNLAFSKVLNERMTEARKAARKRKLDEDEAAEHVFEQFMTAEMIWVRAPRS